MGNVNTEVLELSSFFPGLNGRIVNGCEPRWKSVGSEKKDSIGKGWMLDTLYVCDVAPVPSNVAHPNLSCVACEILVNIQNSG